jgi:hypothetical protein
MSSLLFSTHHKIATSMHTQSDACWGLEAIKDALLTTLRRARAMRSDIFRSRWVQAAANGACLSTEALAQTWERPRYSSRLTGCRSSSEEGMLRCLMLSLCSQASPPANRHHLTAQDRTCALNIRSKKATHRRHPHKLPKQPSRSAT